MYWKLNNNTLSLTDEITDYPINNYSGNADEVNDLITLIHLHSAILNLKDIIIIQFIQIFLLAVNLKNFL